MIGESRAAHTTACHALLNFSKCTSGHIRPRMSGFNCGFFFGEWRERCGAERSCGICLAPTQQQRSRPDRARRNPAEEARLLMARPYAVSDLHVAHPENIPPVRLQLPAARGGGRGRRRPWRRPPAWCAATRSYCTRTRIRRGPTGAARESPVAWPPGRLRSGVADAAGEPSPPDQGADRGAASSGVRAVVRDHGERGLAGALPGVRRGLRAPAHSADRPRGRGAASRGVPRVIRASGSVGASPIRCCARSSRPGSSGHGRRPVIEDLLSTVVEVEESVYKAWFPLRGRPLDILDAFVRLDPHGGVLGHADGAGSPGRRRCGGERFHSPLGRGGRPGPDPA